MITLSDIKAEQTKLAEMIAAFSIARQHQPKGD